MVTGLTAPPPYAPNPGGRRLGAVFALAFVCAVLTFCAYVIAPPLVQDADAERAVRRMEAGMQELKAMRLSLGIALDRETDPALSGIIGVEYSDLTTTLGDLRAKQTSLNPQFAGLVVAWLKQAGVARGDPVALSFSGSFPALNLAVLCACDVLELEAVLISSVGASTYGANIPGFTWLDMEARLFEKGLLNTRTRYASLGGIMDTGGGIDETGIAAGEAAIARHGAVYLREGTPRTVMPDVERRLRLYMDRGRPKAFINVGGNVTSLGWVSEAAQLDNGLLSRTPACSSPQRGTIFRMVEAGVPVIHMINIERLAAAHHLPVGPTNIAPGAGPSDMETARRGHLLRLGILMAVWFCLSALSVVHERSSRRKGGVRADAPSRPMRDETDAASSVAQRGAGLPLLDGGPGTESPRR